MRKITDLNKTMEIPVNIMIAMCEVLEQSCDSHRELIDMFRKESELKKRHRAYLDLRDEMEEKCKADTKEISEIKAMAAGMKKMAEIEGKRCGQSAAHHKDEKKDRVIIEHEDLNIMIEDILNLSDTVDELVNVFEFMLNGGSIPEDDLDQILEEAADITEEVFERYEDADLEKLDA